MSAPASNDAAAAAVAPATDAAAATPAAAAPAAAAAAPPAAPALSGTDLLTLKMIEKALATLNGHKAIAARGVGMLMRNLNGILFGPMLAQSWENRQQVEESKNTSISFTKTNERSLKDLTRFFTNKKVRAQSGASMLLALLNPTCRTESFEHRMVLIWLGGGTPAGARLFKIDGMKRSGVRGLTSDQTTWPVVMTEVPNQGAELWQALQTFVTPGPPKAEFNAQKQAAWDTIIAQQVPNGSSRSIPFAKNLELKGQHVFVALTQDEEGLQVDLKNGLVERLKAISMQLEAMQ